MIVFCSICKNKTTREENPSFPFCSERCKQVDLGLWITESYCIPVSPKEDEEAINAPKENADESSNTAFWPTS